MVENNGIIALVRLVVAVDYRRRTVFIKWLGTHAAYDKIDVRTVKYGD